MGFLTTAIAIVVALVASVSTATLDHLQQPLVLPTNLLPPFEKPGNVLPPAPVASDTEDKFVPTFANNFGFGTTIFDQPIASNAFSGFGGSQPTLAPSFPQTNVFAPVIRVPPPNSAKPSDVILPPFEKTQPELSVLGLQSANALIKPPVTELATKILPPFESQGSTGILNRFGDFPASVQTSKTNLFKTKFIDGPVPPIEQSKFPVGTTTTTTTTQLPPRTFATIKPFVPQQIVPQTQVLNTAGSTAKKPFNIFESYKKLFNAPAPAQGQNNYATGVNFSPFGSVQAPTFNPNFGKSPIPQLENKILPPFENTQSNLLESPFFNQHFRSDQFVTTTSQPIFSPFQNTQFHAIPSFQANPTNRFESDVPLASSYNQPQPFSRFSFKPNPAFQHPFFGSVSPPTASIPPNPYSAPASFQSVPTPPSITTTSSVEGFHKTGSIFETTKTTTEQNQQTTSLTNKLTHEQVDSDKTQNSSTIVHNPTNQYHPNTVQTVYSPQKLATDRNLGVPVKVLALETKKFQNGDYNYHYQLDNGIRAQEQGQIKANQANLHREVVEGSFSYTAPDGQTVSISYVADEQGFKPIGDHIPTPPPIPDAISRAIAYIKAQAQKSSLK